VPAVLLEHWYEQLSRHLGLQYIAANHRNERKGNDNDGDYQGDNGGINNNDNDINGSNGSNGNNIDTNDVDNDNDNNNDNNDNSSSSSSNNDNDKKVNIQRNKLNSIFQFNPNKKDSGIIDHNNDDNNNDDNSDNINHINDFDNNDKNDDNHDNMNINEVLNNLNINTMSDLRGVVYIDGLGDIVDVQPPLANLQVRLCE
jgi:hypothetical protein